MTFLFSESKANRKHQITWLSSSKNLPASLSKPLFCRNPYAVLHYSLWEKNSEKCHKHDSTLFIKCISSSGKTWIHKMYFQLWQNLDLSINFKLFFLNKIIPSFKEYLFWNYSIVWTKIWNEIQHWHFGIDLFPLDWVKNQIRCIPYVSSKELAIPSKLRTRAIIVAPLENGNKLFKNPAEKHFLSLAATDQLMHWVTVRQPFLFLKLSKVYFKSCLVSIF